MVKEGTRLVDIILPPPDIKPEVIYEMAYMPINMRVHCPICGEGKEPNEWICDECKAEYGAIAVNAVKLAVAEKCPGLNIRINDEISWVPPKKLLIIAEKASEILDKGENFLSAYKFAQHLSNIYEFEGLSFGVLKRVANTVLMQNEGDNDEQINKRAVEFVRKYLSDSIVIDEIEQEAWKLLDHYKPNLGVEALKEAITQVLNERKENKRKKSISEHNKATNIKIAVGFGKVDVDDPEISRNLKGNTRLAKAFLLFLQNRFEFWKKSQDKSGKGESALKSVFAKEIGYNVLSWSNYAKDPEGYGISKTKAKIIAHHFDLTLRQALLEGLKNIVKTDQSKGLIISKDGKNFYLSNGLLNKISEVAPNFTSFLCD